MKKIVLLICLMIPLYGQQTETDKEVTKQEQREIRQNLAQQKMVQLKLNRDRGVRSDWDKFEQMHNRMHMKKLDHNKHHVKKPKRGHRILSYVIIGGISFWIGNEYAKKSHHNGHKRHYGWETRGDKK